MGGGAFNALVFLPFLAATCIVAPLILSYLAHCLLVVVEQAAAGADEITWPNESVYDRFLKGIFLLWLGSFTIPVGLLVGALTPWPLAFAPLGGAAFGLCLAGGVLLPWLLVSSLSAESRWMIVSPEAIGQMLGRPEHLAAFYLRAVPVVALGGLGVQLLYLGSVPLAVPGAAVVAFAVFAYARLVGRLALVVTVAARPRRRRRRGRERATALVPPPPPRGATPEPRGQQPSDLPPVVTPEGEMSGYDVVYDAPRPAGDDAPARTRRPVDIDEVPYDVSPAAAQPTAGVGDLYRPSDRELELASGGRRRPRLPDRPWTPELVLEAWRPSNLAAWLVLSAGLALLGTMVALLILFRPV